MNKIMVLCLLLLPALSASAQENKSGLGNWLIYSSLNRTIYTDDNSEGRFGYGVGASRIFSKNRVDIQIGLELNKVNSFKDMFFGRYYVEYDFEYSFNNITIPLLIRKSISNELAVYAGIQGSISFDYEYNGRYYSFCPSCVEFENGEVSGKSGLERGSGGFQVGFDYNFNILSKQLFISSNYIHGILSMNGKDIRDDEIDETLYLRYIQLNLGIRL